MKRQKNQRLSSWSAFSIFILNLSACSLAPEYNVPDIATPPQFGEAALFGDWHEAKPQNVDVADAWWEEFADPVLSELQERVLIDNHNLQATAAQWRVAQAVLDGNRASFWPSVGTTETNTRNYNASLTGASGIATSGNKILNTYAVNGSVSWDSNLWGAITSQVDVSKAQATSSRDNLLAARLSTQATLAQTYFALRNAEALIAVLQNSVNAYQKSRELTQNLYQAGVSEASDVAQAENQLKSAQAQLHDYQLQRAQYEHALAVLLGQAPANFHVTPRDYGDLTRHSPLLATTIPRVPPLLPSTLLQRRPDIAAAERAVAAANAQIGVTRAAFFPSLGLSANGGYRSNAWSRLISAPNELWSIGTTLVLSVFDGGARTAANRQAFAARDQAIANYRQTVLNAFQEVEDNLVAVHHLRAEISLQQEALDAAKKSLRIVQNQYRAGTVSYLNVVSAQNTVMSATTAYLNAQNRHLIALTLLLKNAAGRWDVALNADFPLGAP